eukprot:TRINITY_DN86_c0_g1_i1.p1 TRINITY_DN86_c0_g1~~TRINITY_DN86_c0_g1_i1.p1  ORF type:complete len:1347 (-),score=175.53 TRINITY_DN86_c0_g1_i1:10996-15036(-)
MRETRLFDYASSQDVEATPLFEISVPVQEIQPPATHERAWAGLARDTLWRILNSDQIVFENVITKSALRLSFSSPFSSRPLVIENTDLEDGSVEIFVSCVSEHNGCSLVHLTVDVTSSADPTFDERGRLLLQDFRINCITKVENDVIVGLSNGCCAQVHRTPESSPKMRLQLMSSNVVDRDNSTPADDTSLISYSSADGASSQRSLTSSLSVGLMNRLFRSPTRNPQDNGVDSAMNYENNAYSIPKRRTRASVRGIEREDSIVAVAHIRSELKSFMVLSASGKVCLFVWNDDKYVCRADIKIPVKLSNTSVDQFLVTGSKECAIAVLMVDEEPSADSLRVLNISARLRRIGSYSLSSFQITKRDGPFDRIVAAVAVGESVLLATESGLITDVINVANEIDTGIGLPPGKFWTLVDDFDKEFGLWKTYDSVIPSEKESLMMAHRFTPFAIAKALRLENPQTARREEVDATLREWHSGEEDIPWKRIKHRAEHVQKQENMKVRDMFVVKGIGVVIARQSAVSVFRPLTEAEQKLVVDRCSVSSDAFKVCRNEIVQVLASHGLCQELAARLKAGFVRPEYEARFLSMMKLSVRLSESGSGIPLTDLIVSQRKILQVQSGEECKYGTMIGKAIAAVSPGGVLLRSLLESGEVSTLGFVANECVNVYRMSSVFASGLSWLFQYRLKSLRETIDEKDGDAMSDGRAEDTGPTDDMLNKAYGCLVQAKKWCDELHELENPFSDDVKVDAQFLIDLATSAILQAAQLNGSRASTLTQDGFLSRDGLLSSTTTVSSSLVWRRLAFWLMEKCVRLFESIGAPKHAASCALEGMPNAPNREKHENMRAAAFSRFIDAGEFEAALTTILSDPFLGDEPISVKVLESESLRDAVSLLVNATADHGKLQWLAEQKLPGPLKVMCGHALERRARATETMPLTDMTIRAAIDPDLLVDPHGEEVNEFDALSDYELVYSWHVFHGDDASAATTALEWAVRLNDEGLQSIRSAIGGHRTKITRVQQQARLLLHWVQMKSTALSYVSSAILRQPPSDRYVMKSKFSRLTNTTNHLLVNPSWVSRRLLLAQAQKRCLSTMLSSFPEKDDDSLSMHYLVANGAPFLSESKEGVRWAAATLQKTPSFDNMLLCTELGLAWVQEVSDNVLVDTIQVAAAVAARKDIILFEYNHLQQLLIAVEAKTDWKRYSRQWYAIALESALAASGGLTLYPQWLIDGAAWGVRPECGPHEKHKPFIGDISRVVRALLRCGRPFDAVELILKALNKAKNLKSETVYLPFSVIDTTLEVLGRISTEYPEAEDMKSELRKEYRKHKQLMNSIVQDRTQNLKETEYTRHELTGRKAVEVVR